MKAKVTYLLLNAAVGSLPHTPHAVCGASGITYGHALVDKEHGGYHVLEVPQEKWEGGMDKDVTQAAHRSFQKWIVRVKVEPVLEEAEAELAADLDKAKADTAQALLERDQALKARDAMAADLETMRALLERADAPPPPPQLTGDAPAIPSPDSTPAPAPKPFLLPQVRQLTLETQGDWTYPELKALARERGLELGANPKRTVLIDALLAVPA